jgi:quinohemoprotein ethanol dehydrogenase
MVLGLTVLGTQPLSWASPTSRSSQERLQDGADGTDWPGYGRTYGEQHFSPLKQIDNRNIDRIGLAWSLDLPPGNTVTQPLAIDGVLYFTVGNSIVHAVDALRGKLLWTFDPKANEAAGPRMRTTWGSRGLAWWNGKIYTATVDGRLIAIDARTGQQIWSRQTLRPGDLLYITGAPRVFDGKIIIGNGGTEISDARGYVTTYDADTGALLWRFYLVPGNPANGPDGAASDDLLPMMQSTWAGEWWRYGGGANAWNAFSYDPDTETIIIGTGNGSPWNHKIRSNGVGDNLFICSIVALDAKTGRYKWHYQINPGETWDYNSSMDMHFADLLVDGRTRKVLVTLPKNGFVYVVDRLTGKLIAADKAASHITWADRIDLTTGRPIEDPLARYPTGSKFELWPDMGGAHTGMPSALDPVKGLLFVPLRESGVLIDDTGIDKQNWRRAEGAVNDMGVNLSKALPTTSPKPSSALLAWNVATGRSAWRVAVPNYSGGVLATGGNLVFQGQVDGLFNAYESNSGRRLWSFDAGGAVVAPPITYTVKGQQYLTILSGMGLSAAINAADLPRRFDYRTQARRVLTFKIGGKARLPRSPLVLPEPVLDSGPPLDAAAVRRGAAKFSHCYSCHGIEADAGGGLAPDLRASPVVRSPEAFEMIVRGGALVSQGMPRFAEFSDQDLADLTEYVRERAAAGTLLR